ncbi:MAG: ABC transporter permease, partial [Candidatus Methanofastidiosia archaeon]
LGLFHEKKLSLVFTDDFILLDLENPKSLVAEFHLRRILAKLSSEEIEAEISEKAGDEEALSRIERQRERAREEIRKTTQILQDKNMGYSVILILLLPIFISSGLLVDLVVSEKERRTGEILLSLPVDEWKIISSKILSVLFLILLQLVLWIVILFFMGRVSNLLILIPLFLTALLISSLSAFISVFSKNYREAGFLITILYVFLFAFLFGTSTLYSVAKHLSYLSPLSFALSINAQGFNPREFLYSLLPTLTISLTFLAFTMKMYQRDDFYFGPRPSLFSLLLEFFKVFGKNPFLICFLGGGFSVLLALVLELSVGVILTYFLGVNFQGFNLYLLVFFFALSEEFAKSLSVIASKRHFRLSLLRILFCGALSGIGFSLFENVFFGIAILRLLPGDVLQVMLLRALTAILAHSMASSLTAFGVYFGKSRFLLFLLISTLLHSLYNLHLLGVFS